MKIEITPEEMLERFKLYGEIYLLLAPVCEYDDMDDFSIESYEIIDELDLEDEIFVPAQAMKPLSFRRVLPKTGNYGQDSIQR